VQRGEVHLHLHVARARQHQPGLRMPSGHTDECGGK
jgi:hypothetical protein